MMKADGRPGNPFKHTVIRIPGTTQPKKPMRRSHYTVTLYALAIAIATAGDIAGRPFKLDLKQPGAMSTMVLFLHQGPPPWPDGNCLTIGKWRVLNMHTENMAAFRDKFRVDDLEVLPASDTAVLVTDPRVGREWLRSGLCEHCIPLLQRLEIRSRHREHFQTVPGEEKLAASAWELAKRRDMDLPGSAGHPQANIIAAILPGERLRFKDSTVACSTATGQSTGQRSWELTQKGAQTKLTIYLVKDKTGHYDAIRFRVVKLADELELVPDEWMTWNTGSKNWTTLHPEPVNAQVTYRRAAESDTHQ